MKLWGRWTARSAEKRAEQAAQLREREALVSASDWAITTARAWWDVARPMETLEWVTVAAVVERAREDEGLEVTPEAAAAVLRERLELRGRWGLRTDAYLDADGIDQRPTKCGEGTCVDDAVVNRRGTGPVCMFHAARADHVENPPEPDADGIISSVVHETDWYQPGSRDAANYAFKRWMRDHRKGK